MHTKRQLCQPLVRDDRAKSATRQPNVYTTSKEKGIPPFDTTGRVRRIGYGYLVAREPRSISNKAEKVERVAIIFNFRLSSHVRHVYPRFHRVSS